MLNLSTDTRQCIGDPLKRGNRLGIGISWGVQVAAGFNSSCAGYKDERANTFSPDVATDLLKPDAA
jgi:hypothetical protein